jgi:hypothetical protein
MASEIAYVLEPQRRIPLVGHYDVCVLGGSCTGVFAAVRAAQCGARVALIERQNAFGGVATSGLVNIWHTVMDTENARRIIGGLTATMVERLAAVGACQTNRSSPNAYFRLNTEELKIELDRLVLEHNVTPFLHTSYVACTLDAGRISHVFIENKDGRQAVGADVFVDATGDGDVAAQAAIPYTVRDGLQPPTTCARMCGLPPGIDRLIARHREEFGLAEDRGWGGPVPGLADTTMCAYTHVYNTNAADAAQLTAAEIEGRRHIRAIMDIARKYGGERSAPGLHALASYVGIRETRSFEADYTLTEEDVLSGRRFGDAIANGSYHVDVHNPVRGGFAFKDLDGTMTIVGPEGTTRTRWREETAENPTFYQVPLRTMINRRIANLIMAGRMISTDRGAFGAVRVMVNLNQVGEAAGVAAALAATGKSAVTDLDAGAVRERLSALGAVII